MSLPRLAQKMWDVLRRRLSSDSGTRQGRRESRTRLELMPLEDRTLLATASSVLSGIVFVDTNRNGIPNVGERRLPGVMLTLTGNNQGDVTNATVRTAVGGRFNFTNLLPGSYTISGATGLLAGPGLINLNNQLGGFRTQVMVGAGMKIRNLGFRGLAPAFASRSGLAFPFGPAGTGLADVSHGPSLANSRDLYGVSSDNHTIFAESNGKSTVVDMAGFFDDLDFVHNKVRIKARVGTTEKNIDIELFDREAPQTVLNFLNYVLDSDYDSTIFHRLSNTFVLQGGGFTFNPATKQLEHIGTDPPVINEFSSTRSNLRNTLAMAKVGGDPNSATSEFFFNLVDNSQILDPQNGGFTVFGRLATDTDRANLDALIAQTTLFNPASDGTGLPLRTGANTTSFPSNTLVTDYLQITDIQLLNNITTSVVGSVKAPGGGSTDLVTASITNNQLTLVSKTGDFTGEALVTVRGTSSTGGQVDTTFTVKVRKAPEISVDVTSTPTHVFTATTTVKPSTVADPLLAFTYVWSVNGQEQKRETTSSLTSTFDQSLPGNGVPGDKVTVEVIPSYRNLKGSAATATHVRENTTAVLTVSPTNPALFGATPAYSLVGGADQGLFTVNPTSGALAFASARDFELPTDSNGDNVYKVTVQVTGNGLTEMQEISVNVIDDVVITSPFAASMAENTTAALTVTATASEGSPTFSITGGADMAKFTINALGALSFVTAPDFEVPTDANTDNKYVVEVTVGNGTSTTSQIITITVTDDLTFPPATVTQNVPEGTPTVTVTATSGDGTITYSLTGGADKTKFNIDANTGTLTFKFTTDFEKPASAAKSNTYVVIVTATDTQGSKAQTITINVTDSLKFTSPTTQNVAENTTAVMTVVATSTDGTVKYSLSGGADQNKFAIDMNTGALTFITPPNFEAPTDIGGNNVYEVQVKATDGKSNVSQTINVTVTNVNEAPVITSAANPGVVENNTAVLTVTATDPENNTVTFSITGGDDMAAFSITTGGALTFNTAPDFETPTDVGGNNVYEVQVTADDGQGNMTPQLISVTVTNAVVTFTSSNLVNVPENATSVILDVNADSNETGSPTYSITGGADMGDFTIDMVTGELSFAVTPDFEAPADSDVNNVYVIQVTADDGLGGTQVQTITINVSNAAVTFSSPASFSLPENTTAVGTVVADSTETGSPTYSLSGGADTAKFAIDSMTGALTFVTPPDFEAPTDSDTDNIYFVSVTANDGQGGTAVQAISVTVTDVGGG